MKALILTGLLFALGCGKLSTITESQTSPVVMSLVASEIALNGTVPLTQGCLAELELNPVDGSLMLNPETGDFTYIFQDLTSYNFGKDSFSYKENCQSYISIPKTVEIDTSNIYH